MIPKDPLAGALPTQTNAASPALTGAPPSVTGGVGTGMIPPVGGPALAPVPSPGGNAQVAGAPLSQDGANERQGGAGADLDMVKDRGTPEEFHKKNLEEMGSEKATTLAFDVMKGNRSGESAGMSPEDVRRQGARMNKAIGMETEAQQDKVLNDMVFKPTLATMRAEIDNGVISTDVAGERGTQLIANTSGAETEDELKAIAAKVHNETTGANIKPNGVEKLSWWGKTKKWWQKGKTDPTEQVTGFMGGMNRQELGMFVFQWGAMMMANSQQGLGPAMGQAGLGAVAGHQERGALATEQARKDQEMAIKQQQADAATESAGAATTRAEAYAEGVGAVRGGVGEWKREFYRSIGWSDEKIANALEGIMTSEQIYDEVSTGIREEKARVAREEKMSLPDNMRAKTQMPDGTSVPTAKLTEEQIKLLATEAAKVQTEARGALNPKPRDPEDDFSAAMDNYGTDNP